MATKKELQEKISDLKSGIESGQTPDNLKAKLRDLLKKTESELQDLEKDETPTEKKEVEKKAETTLKKVENAVKKVSGDKKSAKSILDNCRELLAKHKKDKQVAARRVEKRKKAGKPAELTPSETVSKTAKAVSSKVVSIKERTDKGLSTGELNKLSSGIVATIKATLKGIMGAGDKKVFLNDLVDEINSLKSQLPKAAEMGGSVDFQNQGAGMYKMGGGIDDNMMVGTYFGKDAIKGNVSHIAFFKAENGTNIELVGKRDSDSSSGMIFYVAINGRGLYAREYREDAYELYRDEVEKYNKKYARGGYNTGRSWYQDRARHNKAESWEKPFNQRKGKYEDGGVIVDYTEGLFADPRFDINSPSFEAGGNVLMEDTLGRVNDPSFSDVGQYRGGGMAAYYEKKKEDGGAVNSENAEMLVSQVKEIKHHTDEILDLIKSQNDVEAWVIAKAERSSTDLSDIYHYLDGRKDMFCCGGSLEKGGTTDFSNNGGEMEKIMVQLWYVTDADGKVKNISNSVEKAEVFLADKLGYSGTINYVKVPLSDWNAEKVNVGNIKQIAKSFWQTYREGGTTHHNNFNTVKVKFADPKYNYETSVNPDVSEQDVRKYFVGNMFDVGVYPEENMQQVVDIEFISKDMSFYGGKSGENRINEMADHYERYGWAKSNIFNNDSKFFEKIGKTPFETATTSFTGNDINYYDPERVYVGVGGFIPYVFEKGGKNTRFTDYYLVVNLDERGLYSADVRNPMDEIVYKINSAEEMNQMIEDGFLKYKADEDLNRLTKYLMDMDFIPNGSQIYSEEEFDDKIRNEYDKGGNVDERENNIIEILKDVSYPLTTKEYQLLSKESGYKLGDIIYVHQKMNDDIQYDVNYAKGGNIDYEKVTKADEIYKAHNRERISKGIENFSQESVDLWNEKYDDKLNKLNLNFEEREQLNPKNWYAKGGGVGNFNNNIKYLSSKKVYFDIKKGKVYPKKNLSPDMTKGVMIDEFPDSWFYDLNDYDLGTIKNYLNSKITGYAKGGGVKFKDKVEAIKKSLLARKKVPKSVQKEYGKTFSPAEAKDSAKRIAGAMRKKEMANK